MSGSLHFHSTGSICFLFYDVKMGKVMERNFLLKVSRLRLHMIKAKVASYKRMLNIKKTF